MPTKHEEEEPSTQVSFRKMEADWRLLPGVVLMGASSNHKDRLPVGL